MIRACSIGAETAKAVVKSAFHLLPVHPDDFELSGLSFEGAFYMDRAFTRGLLSILCSF